MLCGDWVGCYLPRSDIWEFEFVCKASVCSLYKRLLQQNALTFQLKPDAKSLTKNDQLWHFGFAH
jgi:hypothetical protein